MGKMILICVVVVERATSRENYNPTFDDTVATTGRWDAKHIRDQDREAARIGGQSKLIKSFFFGITISSRDWKKIIWEN